LADFSEHQDTLLVLNKLRCIH